MPPEVDSVRQISVKAAMTDTLFPSTPKTKFKLSWKRLLHLAMLFVLVFGSVGQAANAQTAKTLSQVKKVFVDSFGKDEAAERLRERMLEQLGKSGRVEVVNSSSAADAVIRGSESIWIAGYVSSDPRNHSNARQTIFHGFVSAEVVGIGNETLWSYLVTPSKYRTGSITHDLADQIVKRFIGALEAKKENLPATAGGVAKGVEIKLIGAGATFPAPIYQKWFESFEERNPGAQITYQAVGSEEGLRLLTDGKVDFAGSDVSVSDEDSKELGAPLLHFATVMGAVVPIYNLPGVDRNLNFTPEVLADIYMGKIRKWNDPKIRESNKGVSLPDSEIVAIHRSDGSGTTFVWTDYLSKVSSEWKRSVGTGTTVHWPLGTGAQGNKGEAAAVQQAPNSIGYVELVYALRHQLSFGAVRNSAGEFVQANLASVSAAASAAAGEMTADFRVSITNAAGKDAYPIATFTWWVMPRDFRGAEKKEAFLELLKWMLSFGQKECSALGYAPLPREIVSRELQFLTTLQ